MPPPGSPIQKSWFFLKFIESDACVQSMHIVAIDNIMHTIMFITIGAGAVVTPKMLPI
jgi:hypothetical protein